MTRQAPLAVTFAADRPRLADFLVPPTIPLVGTLARRSQSSKSRLVLSLEAGYWLRGPFP